MLPGYAAVHVDSQMLHAIVTRRLIMQGKPD